MLFPGRCLLLDAAERLYLWRFEKEKVLFRQNVKKGEIYAEKGGFFPRVA